MKIIFSVLSFLLCVIGFAQNDYWQQEVNYTIKAILNPETKLVKATETIVYKNNSPEVLDYIWFHIWPNAYKSKGTAMFTQIENDNSRKDKLKKIEYGNISGLAFKVNNIDSKTEAHPIENYIDIIKLILPTPLKPGDSCVITTPFETKLPSYFSRSGFADGEFMVCQWYPKPAVYDKNLGWNEMPYLDMGEFYAEYGKFDVEITLPSEYVVSATGTLQTKSELDLYKSIGAINAANRNEKLELYTTTLPNTQKTLHYVAENVPDFAFFADKNYAMQYDTVVLPSGKVVDAFSFFYPKKKSVWINSIDYVEEATRKYSAYIGEYPYPTVQAVEGPKNNASGGMEYPMVTLITSPNAKPETLESVIAHEVGHNWFMAILGSNERLHGWMDEGLNSYFQFKYEAERFRGNTIFGDNIPDYVKKLSVTNFLDAVYKAFQNIPIEDAIETPSQTFKTSDAYGMTIYLKTAIWVHLLEKTLGQDVLDKGFAIYFNQWKFKHPQPADFKLAMENAAGRKLDEEFATLYKKGKL